MRHHKGKGIGLVLSGGGAKGAYQIGVIRALADLNVRIDAIAGTSVGALNGAVTASSVSLAQASERLQDLWKTVSENPPLEGDDPPLIQLFEAAGLDVNPTLRNTAILAREMRRNLPSAIKSPDTGYLIDNAPIRHLLGKYVSHDQLEHGLPLYVSIFPNRNMIESVIGFSLAFVGIKDSPKSEFVHIQSLSAPDQQKALLASAALPFLLEAQEIGGERYSDGGMGGRMTAQGNTPIQPLYENGYRTLIVTSLSDNSSWPEQHYPDATIIGIDREESIDRAPLLPHVFDVLSFDPDKVISWAEQGYQDTQRCIKPKLQDLQTN